MYLSLTSRGFSIIELLIVVAILGSLATGATFAFSQYRITTGFASVANDITFHLEGARADALAGAGGEAHGVKFSNDSYTRFSGNTYTAGDSENVVYEVHEGFTLATNLSGSEVVVFNRLTGAVDEAPAVITITHQNSGETRMVTVGAQGDVSISE